MKKNTNYHLEEDLTYQVKVAAVKNRMTLSEYVTYVLTQWLEQEQKEESKGAKA